MPRLIYDSTTLLEVPFSTQGIPQGNILSCIKPISRDAFLKGMASVYNSGMVWKVWKPSWNDELWRNSSSHVKAHMFLR